MRLVVVGVGPDGLSKVESTLELEGDPEGEWSSEEVWAHPAITRAFSERSRTGAHRQVGVGSGDLSWRYVRYRAGAWIGMHRTDTVDCGVVIAGSVTLGLEAEEVVLNAGDHVVIPGQAHAWRAGPDGCAFSTVMHGLAP